MNSKSSVKIAAYAAAVTVLGGSSQAAIVYKNFAKTLTDPDPIASNGNISANYPSNTIGGILFDGSTITLVDTAANGGAMIYAIEVSTKGTNPPTTTAASINATGNYVQTPGFLTAGTLIGDAFTQTQTSISIPNGSANDLYLGVSTPSKQYGWIRFSYADKGKTIIIHEAAFQTTPGQTIQAGEGAPAPAQSSSVGLIGLAGGLATLRRNRKSAAAA